MKRSEMVSKLTAILLDSNYVTTTYRDVAEYVLSHLEELGMAPPLVEIEKRYYWTGEEEVEKSSKTHKWENE